MVPTFDGVYSVLPTPFNPDDSIDTIGLKKIIDLFLKAGVRGFTALGVTSEVARLSERERAIILETVIGHVAGRVPVVIGTTAEGFKTCIDLTRAAQQAGASAVMISPPRMPKLNSDAVVSHFRAVAEAVQIPIVIQDYPPISGFAMEANLLVRIAREISSAACIKLEDAPTPTKVTRIRAEAGAHPVKIMGGLGGVYLLEELIAGADGAMTGFSFDANGTGNTITNIDNADLTADTLNFTAISDSLTLDANTTIASAGFTFTITDATTTIGSFVSHEAGNVGISAGANIDTKFEVGGAASISGNITTLGTFTSTNTGSNSFTGSLDVTKGIHGLADITATGKFIGYSTASNSLAGGLEVTKGVHATGSIKNPIIRLAAIPSLTEEKIASLLLTGSTKVSLNAIAPTLIIEFIKKQILEHTAPVMQRKSIKSLLKPLKHIKFIPSFTDESGLGGLSGGVELDLGKRLQAKVQKNFNLQDDTEFEINYRISDEFNLQAFKNEQGDIGGQVQMNLKL